MDHRLIEEENIAELYVMGRLPPQDEALFEEHLVECRECRERVVWAEGLRSSFRTLGAEDRSAAAGLGFVAWLARRRGVWPGLAVAALLLAVVLPAVLLIELGRLREELATTRSAAVRQGLETTPTPTPAMPPTPAAGEERWAGERGRLEAELRTERDAKERLARQLASLTRPQVNAAVFSLGLVRGEEDVNRVVVGTEPEWIVLSLELPALDFETYRVTLLDSRNRTAWSADGLHPTAGDTLSLGLLSTLLPPGSYRLSITGLPASGPPQPAGEIPFQVVPAKAGAKPR